MARQKRQEQPCRKLIFSAIPLILALRLFVGACPVGHPLSSNAFAWPTAGNLRTKRIRLTKRGPKKGGPEPRAKNHLMDILMDPDSPRGRIQFAVQWMQKRRYFQSNFEYVAALRALTNARYNRDALTLFAEMRGRGFEVDPHASSAALVAFNARGEWERAIACLEELWQHDMVPNSRGCYSALAAAEKGGKWEISLRIMEDMWSSGLNVDERSFMPAIRACENAAEFETGEKLFAQLRTQMKIEHARKEAREKKNALAVNDKAPKAQATPWRVPGAPALDALESPWAKIQKKQERERRRLEAKQNKKQMSKESSAKASRPADEEAAAAQETSGKATTSGEREAAAPQDGRSSEQPV
mmetsp:Transcript_48807/g.116037  ORF Transcript_48807/g.116037 Transcript_48807/m.116037 type:complete len:357 (-) Transcript_48807:35-1105(-)